MIRALTPLLLAAALLAGTVLMWRPAIPPAAAPPQFDPAQVAHGAVLAAIGDCAVCHAGPAGQPYAGARPVPTPFGTIYASNITPDRETGIGTWSEPAFRRAMRDGVSRTGEFLYPAFPYNHFTHATDSDIADIYAFLMTRPAIRQTTPAPALPFPLTLRPLLAGWNLLFLSHAPPPSDPARGADWNRGAYLVEGLGHCQACHTPHNVLGAEEGGHAAFTGGLAEGWDGPGLTAASSPAAIAWSADAIEAYLRRGLDDSHTAVAGPMSPVSHDLASVPAADVRAIATYIASMTGPADPARAQEVAARAQATLQPPPDLDKMAGASIFAGACAGCHGAGAPMVLGGRPSLALGSAVTAASPRNAAQVLLGGLQPQPGERGPWMPPFAAQLTDGQIAAVLDYVRARFTTQPAWSDVYATVYRLRQEQHGS